MQCEVVATSNMVAAVAIPASTRNFRSKTLGSVGLGEAKENADCEGRAIAVGLSNAAVGGIVCQLLVGAELCIDRALKRVLSFDLVTKPDGLKLASLFKAAKRQGERKH